MSTRARRSPPDDHQTTVHLTTVRREGPEPNAPAPSRARGPGSAQLRQPGRGGSGEVPGERRRPSRARREDDNVDARRWSPLQVKVTNMGPGTDTDTDTARECPVLAYAL